MKTEMMVDVTTKSACDATITLNKRTRGDINGKGKEESGRILIETLLAGYCRFLSGDEIPNKNDQVSIEKPDESVPLVKKRKVEIITSNPTASSVKPININPTHHLKQILKEITGRSYHDCKAPDVKHFFLQVGPSNIEAYQNDVITAVRSRDIRALRKMHSQGRILQCCNQFGESILHMACRRGSLDVVKFLVNEAGVCVRVMDDYGRTPLHDAFWAKEPEIELVKLLISICPDLLLISDVRGFVPLSYVRKEHWNIWCQFLEDHRDFLPPKILTPTRKADSMLTAD